MCIHPGAIDRIRVAGHGDYPKQGITAENLLELDSDRAVEGVNEHYSHESVPVVEPVLPSCVGHHHKHQVFKQDRCSPME